MEPMNLCETFIEGYLKFFHKKDILGVPSTVLVFEALETLVDVQKCEVGSPQWFEICKQEILSLPER